MADQKANAQITRETERRRAADAREERKAHRDLVRYGRETQGFIRAAAKLDGVAIRHLRNRAYSWETIATETGRSVEELQAHQSSHTEFEQALGINRDA